MFGSTFAIHNSVEFSLLTSQMVRAMCKVDVMDKKEESCVRLLFPLDLKTVGN